MKLEKRAMDKTERIGMTFVSALLGGGAAAFVVIGYDSLIGGAPFPWLGWVRFGFVSLAGFLCFAAAALYLLGRWSGKDVLKGGLSLIPAMLAVNLIVLAVRNVLKLFQGDAFGWIERLFSHPAKLIGPAAVLIVLVILGLLKEGESKTDSH